MNFPDHHQYNRLLGVLAPEEKTRVYPQLQRMYLPLGFALYEPGFLQKYAYFPADAVVSLQCPMADGAAAETASVGNEGMVGTPIVMGGDSTPGRAIVKIAGIGFRVSAQVVKQEFGRAGPFMKLLLRYTQALITQMSQTAVCTRHHSIDQQLCRSLLMSVDRTQGTEMPLTHDVLANVLGTRRESVTESAGRLQRARLICYARGHISILDRSGLEKRSCECYAVVKQEYARLLSTDLPASRVPSGARSTSNSAGRSHAGWH